MIRSNDLPLATPRSAHVEPSAQRKNLYEQTYERPDVVMASKLEHVSKDHARWYRESVEDPDQFWGELARARLRWSTEFDRVQDCDLTQGKLQWFIGGKINVSVNCLDRHAEEAGGRVALIWEKDQPGEHETVTYQELLETTCQLANTLKTHGVRKGDRVAIYMPMSPLAVAAMLACARIGAVHSVVFTGFSAEALRGRIEDCRAEIVLTADQGVRGGKTLELKRTVDKAVEGLAFVRHVFVTKRTGGSVPHTPKDVCLEEAMAKEATECPPEPLDSEDMLFLLYTSGSTGKPKGVVHTQAGYLLYAALTQELVFDCHPGDIFACVADIGWITGHSYVVYGPLCNGVTSVLFESSPVYPDPGRYWEMVARLRVTQLYVAPTAIRMLYRFGEGHVKKYDRSSLRVLGSVGEPLNVDAWKWYYEVVGDKRCPIVDTWWQTETGGIMITPRPAPPGVDLKPAFPMIPFFGVQPCLMDAEGQEIEGADVEGALCIKCATPGLARGIYGNPERYMAGYFKPYPGCYFSGDGAYRDSDGHYRITGRVDDVINVKSHRLGTAEVESAMNDDPRVAETAVVGYSHAVFGQAIYAYVILKDDCRDSSEAVMDDLVQLVRKKIGPIAVPEKFLMVPGLPKTRSGKIMRRILRKIAEDQPDQLGDISTLADPAVVQVISDAHARQHPPQ